MLAVLCVLFEKLEHVRIALAHIQIVGDHSVGRIVNFMKLQTRLQ